MTERKVDCADNTLSANPAGSSANVVISPLPVAAERVAEANLAGRKPHRRARHRGLAEVERRAVAADAAAHHDEAILGFAQALVGRQLDRIETARYLGCFRMRKHRHGRLALSLLAAVLGYRHIHL